MSLESNIAWMADRQLEISGSADKIRSVKISLRLVRINRNKCNENCLLRIL